MVNFRFASFTSDVFNQMQNSMFNSTELENEALLSKNESVETLMTEEDEDYEY